MEPQREEEATNHYSRIVDLYPQFPQFLARAVEAIPRFELPLWLDYQPPFVVTPIERRLGELSE